ALPPVFRGQILALHPLSEFFMKVPTLRSIAGTYFSSDEPVRVCRRGRTDDCPKYWDVVGAILEAARRYRRAKDRLEVNRPSGSRELPTWGPVASTDPMIPEARAFDEWARHHR